MFSSPLLLSLAVCSLFVSGLSQGPGLYQVPGIVVTREFPPEEATVAGGWLDALAYFVATAVSPLCMQAVGAGWGAFFGTMFVLNTIAGGCHGWALRRAERGSAGGGKDEEDKKGQ